MYLLILFETCPLSRLCVDKQQQEVTLQEDPTSYQLWYGRTRTLKDLCASMPALLHFPHDSLAVQPLPYSADRLFILK